MCQEGVWQMSLLLKVSFAVQKILLEMKAFKIKHFYRIEALCECEPEDRKGLPKYVRLLKMITHSYLFKIFRNVLYGWCVKCRTKFPDDYNKVVGWVIYC